MTTRTTSKRAAKKVSEVLPSAARARRTRTKAVETAGEVSDKPVKRTAKKAAAKTTVRSQKAASGANPYRPGSNMFKITELLLQGGKRSAIVKKLQSKGGIDLHPYTQEKADLDVEKELDKRVTLTAANLARHLGYTVEKTGRGMTDGTIKVVPPVS